MSNEFDEDDESTGFNVPDNDPIRDQKIADSKRERLTRSGFDKEEAETLFPTPESLDKFQSDSLKLAKNKALSLDSDSAEPEDDYEIPADEARELKAMAKISKARQKQQDIVLENEGAAMLGDDPTPIKSLSELLAEEDDDDDDDDDDDEEEV